MKEGSGFFPGFSSFGGKYGFSARFDYPQNNEIAHRIILHAAFETGDRRCTVVQTEIQSADAHKIHANILTTPTKRRIIYIQQQ